MIRLGFKKLTKDAVLPVREHRTDSGFDLFANEDVIIKPGETAIFKTGIATNLPEGYEAQIRPRSGVTSKTKLRVQLGTIDNSYTGELGIIVDNIHDGLNPNGAIHRYGFNLDGSKTRDTEGYGSYVVRKGDKLAQMVVQKLPEVESYEVDELPDTERGSNGFGSTGYS